MSIYLRASEPDRLEFDVASPFAADLRKLLSPFKVSATEKRQGFMFTWFTITGPDVEQARLAVEKWAAEENSGEAW